MLWINAWDTLIVLRDRNVVQEWGYVFWSNEWLRLGLWLGLLLSLGNVLERGECSRGMGLHAVE